MKTPLHLFSYLICLLLFSYPCFAQWTKKAEGLMTRSEVGSVVYNNKAYVFLGFGGKWLTTEPSSEVYDPQTDSWSLLAPFPAGKTASLTHQGVVLIDDNVWHIGGRVGQDPGPLTSEIWIYNISSDSWSKGPQILDPATGKALPWAAGGAALVGRTLHLFGGFIYEACNHDQDLYHLTLNIDEWLANPKQPAPWKNTRAPLPRKRNHFATIVLEGRIYALGGQLGHDCGGGKDMTYSDVYDVATDSWQELTPLPVPRSHIEGSTFTAEGKIYVLGGQTTGSRDTSLVTLFDPRANNGKGSWTELSTLHLPLVYEGGAAKMIGSTLIFSHGGQGTSMNVSNTTYSTEVKRSPVYRLGFATSGVQVSAPGSAVVKRSALLYSIDTVKSYQLTSSAPWLKVSRNESGTALPSGVEVELSVETKGLAAGNYTAQLTATGTGGGPQFSTATLTVNLVVTSETTLEAEDALLNKAIVASNQSGYTGTGFADFINESGDYIEWTLNKAQAALVDLEFRYANGSTSNRPLKVEVNGVEVTPALDFAPTGNWSKWSASTIRASLAAGDNKIRLTAIGSSGANIDNMSYKEIALQTETLEAEDAAVSKARIDKNHDGYTGTGFVNYLDSTGDFVEWTINKNKAGMANLKFRYSNGLGADRPMLLEVNGVIVDAKLSFPTTGSWTSWSNSSVSVNLNSGANKIRLTANGYSGPNVDHLKWSETDAASAAIVSADRYQFNSVESNKAGLAISVAPNPASGLARLSLERASGLPLELMITDMMGNVRKKQSFRNSLSGSYEFSVHDLPAGIYMVVVQQGNERKSARLMVKRN